jgi:hypothetical protein
VNSYCVPPHISYCNTPDGVVVLDSKRGRYFGLELRCRTLLQSLAGAATEQRSIGFDQEGLAEDLASQGVLSSKPQRRPRLARVSLPVPEDSAVEHVVFKPTPVRFHHLYNLVLAFCVAKFKLRFLSLWTIFGQVQRRKALYVPRHGAWAPQLRPLVEAFCALRPFLFTARDACLLDSLVLLEFLARYELFPAWVFGVNTQPFGAHSWLQDEGLVLNGTAEQARAFIPIEVI